MGKSIQGLMRTHTCGELTKANIGQKVTLCGWNTKYRDLGGLHFVDIRDKYGITQLSFDSFQGDFQILKDLSLESVVQCVGIVRERPDSAINKNMKTGEIEIAVEQFSILSKAQEVPFLPHGQVSASEDLRLKYRYMDLRSERLQRIMQLRSQAARDARMALYEESFTEVETPILYKTTPEGARDYIVPSRVHPGKVYALPQSPQTLKQLLMIGNTDKYFQICKCFRDEDLRSDRQPEFSQIDIEVSFATQEYMKNLTTKIVQRVFGFDENFEIPVMSYDEAMDRFGTDKPDMRFDLEHSIVNTLFAKSEFKVLKDALAANGLIKSIFIPKSIAELSRKEIDSFIEIVKPHGGKGVAWFKSAQGVLSGGISKFITNDEYKELGKEDGLYLFFADSKHSVVHSSADALRRHLGKKLELIQADDYKFLWINDWPLLEYDEEEKRFYAVHHPFTMPKSESLETFMKGDKQELINMKAEAYDIVCNGYEMGGGSLRIFDTNVQAKMFEYLGFSKEEAKSKFGFFIEALQYGTPPHGGFAFGLDRTVMLLAQTENIRDVISFPKTNAATDLMCDAPSVVVEGQLEELHIKQL